MPTTSTWYGRVRYTHAMGIDDPLVVRKTGSTPFVPHRSGRGGFEAGTYWTGASMDAYHWPQRNAGVYLAADARAETLEPLGWFGSLLDGKTDPNGLQYMRNRYYDPASGRFTQRDPIGLAGGINQYGYANADPVNFWDPFGLCPDSVKTKEGDCPGGLTTEEWNAVEATYSCMSQEAAKRTRDMLWAGNIRGMPLSQELAGAVLPMVPTVIMINRESSVGNIFFNQRLGPTLVHEGRHVDQFAGMSGSEAQSFLDRFKVLLEIDASAYEANNYSCERPS